MWRVQKHPLVLRPMNTLLKIESCASKSTSRSIQDTLSNTSPMRRLSPMVLYLWLCWWSSDVVGWMARFLVPIRLSPILAPWSPVVATTTHSTANYLWFSSWSTSQRFTCSSSWQLAPCSWPLWSSLTSSLRCYSWRRVTVRWWKTSTITVSWKRFSFRSTSAWYSSLHSSRLLYLSTEQWDISALCRSSWEFWPSPQSSVSHTFWLNVVSTHTSQSVCLRAHPLIATGRTSPILTLAHFA